MEKILIWFSLALPVQSAWVWWCEWDLEQQRPRLSLSWGLPIDLLLCRHGELVKQIIVILTYYSQINTDSPMASTGCAGPVSQEDTVQTLHVDSVENPDQFVQQFEEMKPPAETEVICLIIQIKIYFPYTLTDWNSFLSDNCVLW